MHSSSGSVLLMVLIISAILYLIAATLLFLTMAEVHLSDFEQRSTQAFYVAESSVTLGVAKLRQNPDYRTTTPDTMTIGGNTGLLSVQFRNAAGLYHLILKGTGSVPGFHAAARRTVERDASVKPFVLFAQNAVLLNGNCKITGNVHGNGSVTLSPDTQVTGNVTSSVLVQSNEGHVSGTTSAEEPPLAVPELPIELYYPTYWYDDGTEFKEYTAQALAEDTILLSEWGTEEPPVESITLYSGFPTSDNPAGIFYPASEIMGPFAALEVEGTVIIPSAYPASTFALQGLMKITPVDNFPALISAKNVDMTFVQGLEKFAKSLKKSKIQGLIYSQGDLLFTGNGTTGKLITGSLLGRNINLTTNLFFQIQYESQIFSCPPPGIDFIELGEWREVLVQ